MRILITADLHYDVVRSRQGALEMARRVCRMGGDALVLVGDTAGRETSMLRECLRLFEDFGGRKFIVPGNHCLWCRPGESSLDRYERLIPQEAGAEGFAVLDHEPVVLGEVGLVGSIGWYDYSFREKSLGIPLAYYRAKVAPGAAERMEEHEALHRSHAGRLTERQLDIGTRWMDGQYVHLGMSDEEFVEKLTDKLARQLSELSQRVERIVAFVHHLPFEELVPRGRPDRFAFAAAYMGSRRLGEVLKACPKVTHVYCGHSHWLARHAIDHMTVINVGSTYTEKQLEILEL